MKLAVSDKKGCASCYLCDWTCTASDARTLDWWVLNHLHVAHGQILIGRSEESTARAGEEFVKVSYLGRREPGYQPMKGGYGVQRAAV